MSDVVVIGSGVAGLSSAARLLQQGHRVKVIAKEFTPHTTSDVAAAMWWPFHANPPERVLAWCMASYEQFVQLAGDGATGVVMRNGVFGLGEHVPEWSQRVPGGRPATLDELPPGAVNGLVANAPMIEMDRYMPWLTSYVKELGAVLEQRNVGALVDVAGEADVVVNATGLGAKKFGDSHVFGAQGRVVRLQQVGIEEFLGSEAGDWPLHVFPRGNDVVVGGTYEANVEDSAVEDGVDDAILQRAVEADPRLAGAKRIAGVTGIRPSRHEVRLEAENIDGVRVVHNYGHGGGGVTLSWGCADDVVRLVNG